VLEPSWSYRPFRSFIRQQCSRHIGLPAPGSALAPAKAPSSSGIPSSARVPGRDSRQRSSPTVRPPSRYSPEIPRSTHRFRHWERLSWVSFPLRRSGCRESTSDRFRLASLARARGFRPGLCARVPPLALRCRSQVFPTSQRPSSSRRRPAVFRQVTSMGLRSSGA
jgi:hypothetical protein